MIKKILSYLTIIAIALPVYAQHNRLFNQQPNSSRIYHNIKKLGFLGTALYIAAHPDDENTRLLSWLSNHKMARTGYLSLTRGDGGQNLIGPELREQLGIIRTQELLEARNIDGAQQFFTRANDFGYSKHPDETLEIWNQQEVLEDIIWIIRNFKPDVIINRFDHRTPGSTHGHHTASAILSRTAYRTASDPNNYPRQLQHTTAWQPQRLFFNSGWWFYGSRKAFNQADKSNMLSIDTGIYYPWIGLSNNEIAAQSRSKHQSQGFGTSGTRGKQLEYIELIDGDMPKSNTPDPFAGINTTWTRVNGGAAIQQQLDTILSTYDFKNPESSVTSLLSLHQSINQLKDNHWKKIKIKDLEDIILQVTGIYLEASTAQHTITHGQSTDVQIELSNRSQLPITFNVLNNGLIQIDSTQTIANPNTSNTIKARLSIPEYFPTTTPYYLNQPGSEGMYTINSQLDRGKPETETPLSIKLKVSINGYSIYKTIPIHFKKTDPVRGEIHEPLHIAPKISVSIDQPVYIVTDSIQQIKVNVQPNQNVNSGNIALLGADRWQVNPTTIKFDSLQSGNIYPFYFTIKPPKSSTKQPITAQVTINQQTYDQQVTRIDYNHIPNQQYLRTNQSQLVHPELINNANTIAYINGAGDDVAKAIQAMGCRVISFEPIDVPTDLSQFDAVVIGVRAYNVATTSMANLQDRLYQYVTNGGTLITQYNTSRGIDYNNFGLLPITLSRKRVTDQQSRVNLLAPEHRVLSYPNKITSEDFEHWVQERGLYFPDQWDPAFTPILGMKDQGEPMTKGSLLVASLGKGHVVYTGLSFFRELPAGVSGAYRLFANLINLGTDAR